MLSFPGGSSVEGEDLRLRVGERYVMLMVVRTFSYGGFFLMGEVGEEIRFSYRGFAVLAPNEPRCIKQLLAKVTRQKLHFFSYPFVGRRYQ